MFASSPKGSVNGKQKPSILPKTALKNVQSAEDPEYVQEPIDEGTQTNLGINVRPTVQDDFRNLLLEFVINCLLDQPKDVVNYAADYFVELQERQHTMIIRDYETSEDSGELASDRSSSSSEAGSKQSGSGKGASTSDKEIPREDEPKFDEDIAKLNDRSTTFQQYG